MPLLLHIETSTRVCSVALSEDGKLLALREQGGEYSHAENLTLFIEDVMLQASRKLSDIDGVAVSIGPGSYTGLRIGVSTAKGLCYGLQKPIVTVSTLEALAQVKVLDTLFAASHSLICPMLDARRMEVYCAVFNASGEMLEPVSAKIMDAYSFLSFLEKGKMTFIGDGALKCQPIITHPNAVFAPDVVSSARNMIALAEKEFALKKFADLAYFEPVYLKEFIAGK